MITLATAEEMYTEIIKDIKSDGKAQSLEEV